MTVLHKLVAFLVFLMLVAMGVMLIMWAWSSENWQAAVLLVEQSRLAGICAGAGLLCLALLFVLSGLPRKKQRHFLSFDDKGGTTSISTDAIADYVAKLSDEFPSVLHMRPKVLPAKNTINVVANVKIKAGPQIHEVCELLQERIRASVTEGLGISEIGHVEVIVDEIVSAHKPE